MSTKWGEIPLEGAFLKVQSKYFICSKLYWHFYLQKIRDLDTIFKCKCKNNPSSATGKMVYFLSIPKYINGNTTRQCSLCYGLPTRYIFRPGQYSIFKLKKLMKKIPNIFLTTLKMNKCQWVYLS